LAGTFNPAIFTARLSQVLDDYRDGKAVEGADSLYSDPVVFFRDATHPTQGLCSIVDNAMARLIEGDKSRPSMQRLDTAFGGGKTHSLIALTHVAKQGNRLASITQNILPSNRLPDPGAIQVVGIIGDTVDTLRETSGGGKAKPNTLWWLIAQQTLSEDQQQPISSRLDSPASPGSTEFFDALFGGKKTVLIIDEIAQYLSRMEAAFPGQGAEQTAAFLMALSTYAESRDNLAIVISLASATNAFGDFNKMIKNLMSTHGMTEQEAEATTETAHRVVMDVVTRASESTTPVQEGDLSRIMAKRLFITVDQDAGAEVADAFIERIARQAPIFRRLLKMQSCEIS
jgi:predicted AAA+ superfamily ATPase